MKPASIKPVRCAIYTRGNQGLVFVFSPSSTGFNEDGGWNPVGTRGCFRLTMAALGLHLDADRAEVLFSSIHDAVLDLHPAT